MRTKLFIYKAALNIGAVLILNSFCIYDYVAQYFVFIHLIHTVCFVLEKVEGSDCVKLRHSCIDFKTKIPSAPICINVFLTSLMDFLDAMHIKLYCNREYIGLFLEIKEDYNFFH